MTDLFNTGIRPIVDDWLLKKSQEVRNYGDYWSASSAGYCMRKNIMERLGVPPVKEDARKQRIFSSGDIFHEWMQRITKEAGLSVAQELELQDEELMIRGHIDDLVLVGGLEFETDWNLVYNENLKINEDGTISPKDPKKPTKLTTRPEQHLILYDYKTAHSRSFHYAKDRPMSHYHKMQLGTYMYMLRKFKAPEIPKNLAVIRHDPYDPAAGSDKWSDLGKDVQKELLETGYSHDWEMPGDETMLYKVENLAKDLTEARILSISKDDLCMVEKQLLWTPELEFDVFDYWNKLNAYWKLKKLPRCTCADFEGGFMAKEAYNPYFYNGEPCSLQYFEEWKKTQASITPEVVKAADKAFGGKNVNV